MPYIHKNYRLNLTYEDCKRLINTLFKNMISCESCGILMGYSDIDTKKSIKYVCHRCQVFYNKK